MAHVLEPRYRDATDGRNDALVTRTARTTERNVFGAMFGYSVKAESLYTRYVLNISRRDRWRVMFIAAAAR